MDGTQARALLGVPTHATKDHVRRAFRGAAFDAHPDRGGDAGAFRSILSARDLLLASAPDAELPVVDRRFDVVAPARPSFSATDVPRRRATSPGVVVEDRSFDDVLAEVLAA